MGKPLQRRSSLRLPRHFVPRNDTVFRRAGVVAPYEEGRSGPSGTPVPSEGAIPGKPAQRRSSLRLPRHFVPRNDTVFRRAGVVAPYEEGRSGPSGTPVPSEGAILGKPLQRRSSLRLPRHFVPRNDRGGRIATPPLAARNDTPPQGEAFPECRCLRGGWRGLISPLCHGRAATPPLKRRLSGEGR